MPIRHSLRSCLAVCALAAAVLAFGQVRQPTVTLTTVTTKTSNVAAEIKKQTGVSVVCNPTVANEPIMLSVKDAPLDELLAKIARVTGGEVVKQGDGYILTKSDKLRTEEANRETGWVVAAFDRAKKKASENNLPERWDKETLDGLVSKAAAAREELASRIANIQRREGAEITMFDSSAASSTPASGAAKRALALLPSSVLASIGPGDRVVYSTLPNRMQRRMPINVTQIVNDFVYNHNMLAQAAPQLRPQPGVNIVGGLTAGQPIQGVVETHLVLSRSYRSSTVSVEIKFVDRNGLFVGQGQTSITPEYSPITYQSQEDGKVIELSELSRQMAVIMAQETGPATSDRAVFQMATVDGGGMAFVTLDATGNLQKKFPDELLNVFVNPDRYDPTSLYVSECFLQAAKAEGKSIVASFPDSVVRDLARILVRGNVTHKTVLASAPAFGIDVADEEGTFVVTPTWANAARNARFDRDQAAKLFRSVNARGFGPLDDLAAYSNYLTLGQPERPLDMIYLSLIDKNVGDQFNQYVSMNLDMLRLYSAIPANMKSQAGEQLNVMYRNLTQSGKQAAEHAYYARSSGLMAFPSSGVGERSIGIVMTERGGPPNRQGPPANSILTEPTEALPNGIPAEAVVTINRRAQEGVFATMTGQRGGAMMTAQELGMHQGMLEANLGGGGQIAPFDKFQPAQVINVEILLNLGDFGRPSAYFKDGWIVTGSRAVSYGQLPEGFREQVEQAKTSMSRPPIPPIDGNGRVRIGGRGGGGG